MMRTIRSLRAAGMMAGLLLLGSTARSQITVSITANPSTTANVPLGSSNYHVSEHIYLASEIGTNMTIHHINFQMTSGAPFSYGNVALYLKTTASATLATGAYNTAGYTQVYNGTMAWTANSFQGVDLTTPFAYTTAAGNLELMIIRTNNVSGSGPIFGSATGNSGGAGLLTSRRYNSTVAPVNGVTSLTSSSFRTAVQFIQYPPCTDPPTAGTTTASVNPVCSGNTTVLSLTGGTSGIGQTYLWLQDGSPAPGVNTNATYTATITASHNYSCTVTCGLNSDTSAPLTINLNTSTFPEDFSSASFPPNCFANNNATYLIRNAANGYAAAGTGSAQWNFYNAANATVITLTSPTFAAFGTPKQLSFDVAGATYTGGEIDQMFVEASTDGGSTWPITLASLDNNPTNGKLNPTHLTTTASYAPTVAGDWSTLSYLISGTVNRIRWRGVSNFGNNVFVDNAVIGNPPACTTPDNVSISNITSSQADVSWSCLGCTGSYYVEYGAPGFVPGTGASAGGGTIAGPFATTSGTITGLSATTQYDVYVRQECTAGVVYSTNSSVTSFLSGCTGASCAYDFHLTDNYGDGWNGALIDVRMNGITLVTLGSQITACEASVSVNICEGATITLVCTNAGIFPDEPGLTMTDPFGAVLFETRGTTFYDGNCAITYPNPGTLEDLTTGTKYTGVGNCTPPPCVDPPVAGTISGDNTICSGTGTTLTMSNTISTGLFRQWQQSSTGTPGSWSDIGGANGQSYTTPNLSSDTYYRFWLTCGAGADTSAAYLVDVSLFACYCTPAHTPGCGNGNITNVTLNTLNYSSTCNPPAYEAIDPGVATTTVQQGVSYNISVTTDQSCIISVWVDWDHNNVFDASEWTQVATSSDGVNPSTVALPVPLTAPLGATAMRVRSRFAGNVNGATDACTSFGSGEGEDYIISVDPAPPCLPASALTFSNISATSFDVNWTNGANSCGLAVYNVEYGPPGFTQGTGTTVGPVTGGPVTISGLTAGTVYDVYVTRDCNPCGDGTGPSTLGTTVTYPDCSAAQAINCPFGSGTFGANHPGAWTFLEPLFGFQTVGAEQLFFLDASVLGNYTMQLTANAGNSIVAIYIKPVGGPCDATGWTYVGTNQFTIQSFTFPIAATGQYYVLVDPVSSSLDISTYLVSFVCPPQNVDCANAQPIACGQEFLSTTVGQANTLPPSACPFSGTPSTGGSLWYSYTAPANAEVTFSTCNNQSFDTRISVFTGDCNNLTCMGMNDDGTGCPNLSSSLRVSVQAGQTYYVAIHGYGASEGIFDLTILCEPPCTPAITNDVCSAAIALTPALEDGSGVPTVGDNTCAHVDANTTCDLFGAMQGVWYSFNSGANTVMSLDLLTHAQNPALTSNTMSYALFDGGCSGLGALGELDCATDADGSNIALPTLTANTDYLLYLWNDGGLSSEGTFSVLLHHPSLNDAAIDTIYQPDGEVCSTDLDPVVLLRNNGVNTLTDVDIVYDVDGGTSHTFHWTGSLASQATESVALPTISAGSLGTHTVNVHSALPNGVADEIPANDAASKTIQITGEACVVVINTDNNGGQLTWSIVDLFAFPVASGGPYPGQDNQAVSTTVCLPTNLGNCYSFSLADAGGDGLCCLSGNGSWSLQTLNGRVLLHDQFKNAAVSPANPTATAGYGIGHEFCLPAGPTNILSNECNVFTNSLLSKVYTGTIGGVVNYQFEFSDPDAGFRRRISVPRNWVRFDEMISNPLTPGTVYFARARADQGATGFSDDHFGAGCEMAIDPASIGCTQLIDNVALPTHSCGVTKGFGGSDKIWAQPQAGATQYKFRFVNAGDGYDRTILRPSYVCLLSWVSQPLVNGHTYSVTVNAFVNGNFVGFCGAACSVTINNAFSGGNNNHAMTTGNDAAVAADVDLFPNPTREGQVTLRLGNLEDATQHIAVDVFDLFGKRVMSKAYENEGHAFSRVIDLDRSMGAGVYLVHITVNGKVTTQRLSVL